MSYGALDSPDLTEGCFYSCMTFKWTPEHKECILHNLNKSPFFRNAIIL